jgi:uncharacterized membrane protein
MMFYFYIPEGICFAAFLALSLHMVILCKFSSVGWVKYDVLLFIILMLLFYSVIVHMFLLTCVFLLCFFVSFLFLVCVYSITTCKERQQKQRSRFLQEYKRSYTPEDGHVGRNM